MASDSPSILSIQQPAKELAPFGFRSPTSTVIIDAAVHTHCYDSYSYTFPGLSETTLTGENGSVVTVHHDSKIFCFSDIVSNYHPVHFNVL